MVINAARRSPTGAHGRELAGHQSTGSQRTLIRPDTRDTAAVPDFEFAVIEERTLRAFVRARVERKKPCYPMRVLSGCGEAVTVIVLPSLVPAVVVRAPCRKFSTLRVRGTSLLCC